MWPTPTSARRSTICVVLDGFSRNIVNWDIRESMTEADIEIILQASSEGEVPRGAATDHLGQRPTIHRQGLQRVHSNLRHDARPDLAVLPAIEREDRTVVQIAEERVHPARDAAVA